MLGMDRFGSYLDSTMRSRAAMVVELCNRGFASNMVLSHDTGCYIDWLDPGP